MCGVSVTTLWRLVAKNVAPPPVYPTPRSARWKRGDLVAYVSSLQPRKKRRSGCLVKAPRNAAG
jgi:predicted DNA-binding transcriptional regulator AlpA